MLIGEPMEFTDTIQEYRKAKKSAVSCSTEPEVHSRMKKSNALSSIILIHFTLLPWVLLVPVIKFCLTNTY